MSLILGLLVLVASSLFNFVTSELIQYLYPDLPVVPDLLFDIFPYVPWLQYVFDSFVAASIIMMVYYAFGVDRKRSGYYFFTVGIGYLARAILMALTPLGQPVGNNETMGIGLLLNIYQHGMFPSGHTYLTAVIFFLIDRERAPRLKIATGILCALGDDLPAAVARPLLHRPGGRAHGGLPHETPDGAVQGPVLESPTGGKPRHGKVPAKRATRS